MPYPLATSRYHFKTNDTKIGVLMVWAKEGSTWRLYARQVYRL